MSTVHAQVTRPGRTDPVWIACAQEPRRACLLAQAFASALAIEPGLTRHNWLRAVAEAQEAVGLPSAPARAAAAIALDEAISLARAPASMDADRASFALQAIALAQLERGATDVAGTTLREALQIAKSDTYLGGMARRAIGEAQTKAGFPGEAATTFAQALAVMQSLDDSSLRANGPRLVAEALLDASLRDEAIVALNQAQRAAGDIRDERIHAQALAFVAATKVRAGLANEATDTFERALERAAAIRPVATRNEALRAIAAKQAEAARHDAAAATLAQTLRFQATLSPEDRFSEFMSTGRAMTRLGLTATAAPVFRQAGDIAKETKRAVAILGVAEAQAKAGLVDDAVETLRAAPSAPSSDEGPYSALPPMDARAVAAQNQNAYDRRRTAVIVSVAEAQSRQGLRADVERSLNEALRIAGALLGAPARAQAFWSVVRARIAAGLPDGTGLLRETTRNLLAAARENQNQFNSFPRDSAFALYAQSLADVSGALTRADATDDATETYSHAQDVADAITDHVTRARTLRAVAETGALSQRVGDALRVAQSITLPTERTAAFISIAKMAPE